MNLKNTVKYRPNRLLAVLVLLAFGLRVGLATQPIEVLLHKFFVDDTFYYYALAQNIVEGHGVVFNQGVPTNGFHPLYAMLLIPIFELLSSFGPNVPIYASLVLLSTVTALTALPIYGIGNELHSETAGLLAAFFWLFNPYVLFVSLSGLETPLQTLFIALLLWYILVRVDRNAPTYKQTTIVGGLIALAFLSRMDSVLLGIGVFLALALRSVWKNGGWVGTDGTVSRIAPIVSGGLVASLLVSPWILWNLLVVGRLTPVSGAALRALRLEGGSSYWEMVILAIYQTVIFVWNYFFYALFSSLMGRVKTVAAFSLLVMIVLTLYKNDILTELSKRLDFLIIGGMIYYPFYWFYELGVRQWYSLFTSLILTIILALAITEFIQFVSSEDIAVREVTVVIIIFSGLFIASGAVQYQEGAAPQELTKYEVAQYIDAEIAANTPVGSFNTGIYQYYTSNHDVINLDGVMNPEAYHASQQEDIKGYICDKQIEYIADPPDAIESYHSELKLKPIAQFPTDDPSLQRGNTTYALYQVRGCD